MKNMLVLTIIFSAVLFYGFSISEIKDQEGKTIFVINKMRDLSFC
jgi:hypothetical protein